MSTNPAGKETTNYRVVAAVLLLLARRRCKAGLWPAQQGVMELRWSECLGSYSAPPPAL